MDGKAFVTLLLRVTSAATHNTPPCIASHVASDYSITFDANAPLWYAPSPANCSQYCKNLGYFPVEECWSQT